MGEIIKKIVGCFIAMLLLLGIVPVGLFYFATPVIAEGQFIKILPVSDTFVYSDAKNKSRVKLDNEYDLVGNYWNTYLKFDLSELGNAKKTDVSKAVLRLALSNAEMNVDGSPDCTFNVSYIQNNNWNENMNWSGKPSGEEQFICTAGKVKDSNLIEIDITEFLKKAVSFDDKTVTFKLSPGLSCNTPVQVASNKNEDPTVRPYLKVVIGEAVDTDSKDLRKSSLDTAVYVSKAQPETNASELLSKNNGVISVDNGSVAYLKFNLNALNIIGAVKSAKLNIRSITKSSNVRIDLCFLDNNNWDAKTLTYNNTPTGHLTLIRTFNGIDIDGGMSVDVTDIIYNMVKNGIYTASFVVDGTKSEASSTNTVSIYSSQGARNAPNLSITSTDNAEIIAMREAVSNLKGSNSSFDNITHDLPHSYVAENGLKVGIKWVIDEEFSITNILGITRSSISSGGKISQPSYFEKAKKVRVKAVLNVGSQTEERFIDMTILPMFGVPGRLQSLKNGLTS